MSDTPPDRYAFTTRKKQYCFCGAGSFCFRSIFFAHGVGCSTEQLMLWAFFIFSSSEILASFPGTIQRIRGTVHNAREKSDQV